MLTPQEVKDKKFEKAVFGGYEVNVVDEFLDAVTEDYTALFKENATLKSKLKVLVDKIEEYRSVDDEMRKALLVAQRTAGEYMQTAKKESEAFLHRAKAEAEIKLQSLREELQAEERRLKDAKQMSAAFISEMILYYKEAETSLSELLLFSGAKDGAREEPKTVKFDRPGDSFPAVEEYAEPPAVKAPRADMPVKPADRRDEPAPEPPRFTATEEQTHDGMRVQVYELNLERRDKTEKGLKSASAEGEEEFDTGTFFTPKPKFDFNNLKFGKDYEGEDL